MSKTTWIIISLLVILLVSSIFTGGFGIFKEKSDNIETKENDDSKTENNGKIKIVEFSDFECPFCVRTVPTVKKILEKYGDKVDFEYKHFPLSFHPNAQISAEASECARDQGEFMEYHYKLFENQNALDKNSLKKYAKDLGLNVDKFNECLDSGEKTEIVRADFEEGQSKGVSGTPTFFINDKKIVGAQPYSIFEETIENEL